VDFYIGRIRVTHATLAMILQQSLGKMHEKLALARNIINQGFYFINLSKEEYILTHKFL
jgi:hypothetical protein